MHAQDQKFAQQTPVQFDFCGYKMLFPSQHHLMHFFTPNTPYFQPHRESGLLQSVLALKHLNRKGAVIDIGANVGDSLAVIARHCDNPVICVEGSDFFFDYLQKNVEAHFQGRAKAIHGMVTKDESEKPAGLAHWGGTAKPEAHLAFTEKSSVVPIRQLIKDAGDVSLLKLDTDGHDIGLIEAVFSDGTIKPSFPIYFELEFMGANDDKMRQTVSETLDFFEKMVAMGYDEAFLWDDPGRFFGWFNLRNPFHIVNTINYMCHFLHRPIFGCDVCLVHKDDTAFRNAMAGIVSQNVMIQLPLR